MARLMRPNQSPAWMDGYRPAVTVEDAALALERRLRHREDLRLLFPEASRLPLSELDQWSD